MGAACTGEKAEMIQAPPDRNLEKRPLIKLKSELKKKIRLPSNHGFESFIEYGFWNSYRQRMIRLESELQRYTME
jgi:hypothetical protein